MNILSSYSYEIILTFWTYEIFVLIFIKYVIACDVHLSYVEGSINMG